MPQEESSHRFLEHALIYVENIMMLFLESCKEQVTIKNKMPEKSTQYKHCCRHASAGSNVVV
jgi:hypothetical protein